MIRRRRDLALTAALKAQQIRSMVGLGLQDPAPVFDIAEELGIELRFVPVSSLEGMYQRHPSPVILVSSLRPPGRQVFTGAHELGHHVYGHGVSVDKVGEIAGKGPNARSSPEEYLADRFASFFLMPKTAIKHGFRARGWDARACTPEQVYIVAGWLGVGYATLLYHMQGSLKMLSFTQRNRFLNVAPKDIRADMLGREVKENLVVVDEKWSGRSVDVQVGDLILLRADTVCEADNLLVVEETEASVLLAGTAPGIGRVCHPRSG